MPFKTERHFLNNLFKLCGLYYCSTTILSFASLAGAFTTFALALVVVLLDLEQDLPALDLQQDFVAVVPLTVVAFALEQDLPLTAAALEQDLPAPALDLQQALVAVLTVAPVADLEQAVLDFEQVLVVVTAFVVAALVAPCP